MGIKSTYEIERAIAEQIIISKLYSCTNEQLANILEAFKESYFRNYIVRDREWMVEEPDRVIQNISEFESDK